MRQTRRNPLKRPKRPKSAVRLKPAVTADRSKTENLVKRVYQDGFTEFVAAPYVIIKAGVGDSPDDFHYALRFRLGTFHVPRVRLGVVDLNDIEWTSGVKFYVYFKLAGLKMEPDSLGRPPPGYYLFAHGTLLGFHPGNIEFAEDGGALGAAAVTGIFALLTKSEAVAKLIPQMAMGGAGERVADWFTEVIRVHIADFFSEPEEELPSGKSAIEEQLHLAFEALGLTSDATDEDVRAAHRRLIREHHPDKAGKSMLEQEQATKRSAELNAARDFIQKWRKRN